MEEKSSNNQTEKELIFSSEAEVVSKVKEIESKVTNLVCIRCEFLTLLPLGKMTENLISLRLIDQRLETMELFKDFKLQNLLLLSLEQNQITAMEYLESFPRVRTLVLSENKISKIEGLLNLSDLRVLWMQSNLISNLEGIQAGSLLKELNLGNNKLSEVQQLATLNSLSCLKILTLCDETHGDNEVCHLSNYNQQVAKLLTNVTCLDNIYISREANRHDKNKFLNLQFELNVRLADLKKEHQRNSYLVADKYKASKKKLEEKRDRLNFIFSNMEKDILSRITFTKQQSKQMAEQYSASLLKLKESLNKLKEEFNKKKLGELENAEHKMKELIQAFEDKHISEENIMFPREALPCDLLNICAEEWRDKARVLIDNYNSEVKELDSRFNMNELRKRLLSELPALRKLVLKQKNKQDRKQQH
eukprot:augustus_masked-scaffold_6-processed-gene-7.0-mRNA-1 protein AED:1.00 eAED:1.00 QI:0/-1/0/0/-1/1/1/0/419